MLQPFQDIYQSISGSSITLFPVANIARFRSIEGEIQTLDITVDNAVTADTVFNLTVNGIAQFSDGSRPKILAGQTHVSVTGLSIAVEDDDLIGFDCEDVGSGLADPVYFRVAIEDGQAGGGGSSSNIVPIFSDNFPGASLNLTDWTVSAGTTGVASNRLAMTHTGNQRVELTTHNGPFYARSAQVKMVNYTATPGTYQILQVYDGGSLFAFIRISGVGNQIEIGGMGLTTSPVATYNATNHVYFRIIFFGSNVFFQVSANGTDWTTLGYKNFGDAAFGINFHAEFFMSNSSGLSQTVYFEDFRLFDIAQAF